MLFSSFVFFISLFEHSSSLMQYKIDPEDQLHAELFAVASKLPESNEPEEPEAIVPPNLAWYFHGGSVDPLPDKQADHRLTALFPEEDPYSDRIINQLMFVPSRYQKIDGHTPNKTIVLYDIWEKNENYKLAVGDWVFKYCPVSTCTITQDLNKTEMADLVMFRNRYEPPNVPRHSHQIYMHLTIENPMLTQYLNPKIDILKPFNWTSTYRMDSDIVVNYLKWFYYDQNVRQKESNFNYARKKSKLAAWTSSNCHSVHNNRNDYVKELQNYVTVDVYGRCGTMACPDESDCFKLLGRDYKFYLAFENSNCRDYITEKFFVNALGNNMVPIVMGARLDDYRRVAPENSFIHVDEFGSPRELAAYLDVLDNNDELYNNYFKWKGTGQLIFDNYWCRLCAVLHDEDLPRKPRTSDFNRWWREAGLCTNGTWPLPRSV